MQLNSWCMNICQYVQTVKTNEVIMQNIHISLKIFLRFKFVVYNQIMNLLMNTEGKYNVMENVGNYYTHQNVRKSRDTTSTNSI